MHKQGPARLSVDSPGATIPAMISGYARMCDGEWVVVFRPDDGRVLVVHVGAEGARWYRGQGGVDLPRVPDIAATADEALALVRTERSATPKPSSTTLRGQWIATLVCADGVPVVEIARKVASYVTVGVRSDPNTQRWHWVVERQKTWAAPLAQEFGIATGLKAAITEALSHALDLAGKACSVRDLSRRSAMDAAYAETRPLREPKARKDNSGRIERAVRKTKGGKRKAAQTSSRAPGDASPAAARATPTAGNVATEGKSKAATKAGKRTARATERKVARPCKGKSKAPTPVPAAAAPSKAKRRKSAARATGRKVARGKTVVRNKAPKAAASAPAKPAAKPAKATKAPKPPKAAHPDQLMLGAFKDALASALEAAA